MAKVNLVALSHALSGATAMIVSAYAQNGFLASVRLVRPLGFVLFAGGMLLFGVTIICLGRASLGEVEPVTSRLITTGPYRFVRHPLYLSMFVAVVGLAVAFRSLWGMLITLAVFVPLGLYRASLEEEALAQRFGEEWQAYARRTHFLLPWGKTRSDKD